MSRDPKDRLTAKQILSHPFMKGATTPAKEIQADFKARKALVDQDAHEKREEKRQERKNVIPTKNRSRGSTDEDGFDSDTDEKDLWKGLDILDYDVDVEKQTRFFTTGDPLDYFTLFVRNLTKTNTDFTISKTNLSVNFDTELVYEDEEDEEMKEEEQEALPVKCMMRIFECQDFANKGKHCIDFVYKDPVTKKEVTRDERAPFNFKKLRNMKELVNFWDTTFEQISDV